MEKLGLKKINDTEYEGKKYFPVNDLKLEVEESDVFISGYVNTKNVADSYGDIPTNFNGPVYELTRYSKNKVLLVDHENSAGYVAGEAVIAHEDELGLFCKFKLMKNPQVDVVRHAIEAAKEGILKGFSIGGKWLFEDPKNQNHLTKAIIGEISIVAVGADMHALITQVGKKKDKKTTESSKKRLAVEALISAYREDNSKKTIQAIEQLKG